MSSYGNKRNQISYSSGMYYLTLSWATAIFGTLWAPTTSQGKLLTYRIIMILHSLPYKLHTKFGQIKQKLSNYIFNMLCLT